MLDNITKQMQVNGPIYATYKIGRRHVRRRRTCWPANCTFFQTLPSDIARTWPTFPREWSRANRCNRSHAVITGLHVMWRCDVIGRLESIHTEIKKVFFSLGINNTLQFNNGGTRRKDDGRTLRWSSKNPILRDSRLYWILTRRGPTCCRACRRTYVYRQIISS